MANVLASLVRTEVYTCHQKYNPSLFLFVDCYDNGLYRWSVSSCPLVRKKVPGFIWDHDLWYKPSSKVYRFLRTETPTTIDESEIWE